jgi:hypothetical protein
MSKGIGFGIAAVTAVGLALALLASVAEGDGSREPARGARSSDPMLGVVTQTHSIPARDVRRMRRAGVDSVRFVVPWGQVEPGPGAYGWDLLDGRVLAASQAGAVVTATVFGAPGRFGPDAPPPTSSPAEMSAWLGFLGELVARYGPGGSFIEAHPGARPIRRWQIWNEPNLTAFWGETEPSPAEYVRLLDASAERIRTADPGATVIAAGLSPAARGTDPLVFLDRMYRRWQQLGAAPSFDELALHPYAQTVRASRRAIERAIEVARKWRRPAPPITIAEIAWGSAGLPGYPLAGTPESQARKLGDAYELFERKADAWKLSAVYWYALRDLPADVDGCGFCDFTGLLDDHGRPKPAWRAFRSFLRNG